jgi:hypothetical protein
VEARKELFPLLHTAKEAKRAVGIVRKQPITAVSAGSAGYISLRVFDGVDRAWYDGLDLPERSKTYVAAFVCEKINRSHAFLHIPLFNITLRLDNYDILSHCYTSMNANALIEVTAAMRSQHPTIWT